MNSTLQCLAGINELANYFISDAYNKHRVWDGTYESKTEREKRKGDEEVKEP